MAVLFVSSVVLGFEQRDGEFTTTRAGAITTVIGVGAIVAVGALYEVGFTATSGQTVGKRRRALKVVSMDGGRVGLRRSVVRFAARAIPWAVCLAGWSLTFPEHPVWSLVFFGGSFASLGLMAWAFRDPDGRGVHDRIAGTRVIAQK